MDVGNTRVDTILLGTDTRGYFITARGSVRAVLCYPLRETVLARLEATSDVPAVYVELSECTYMDSTFIGLLVAMDRRLQRGSGGRLHVVRPSVECMDLFRQLGLQDILLIEDTAIDAPAEIVELSSENQTPGAEFLLRAHEALMETSEEARKKFSLLKDVLERTLKAGKPPQDTP